MIFLTLFTNNSTGLLSTHFGTVTFDDNCELTLRNIFGGEGSLEKTTYRRINSAIHKAAGLTVHGRFTGLPGIIPKTSKETTVQNGPPPPETVLYGGRLYGGFVNSVVRVCLHMTSPSPCPSVYHSASD